MISAPFITDTVSAAIDPKNPHDRLFGSIAAETVSVINGADIIRTHNVEATKDAITIALKLSK